MNKLHVKEKIKANKAYKQYLVDLYKKKINIKNLIFIFLMKITLIITLVNVIKKVNIMKQK